MITVTFIVKTKLRQCFIKIFAFLEKISLFNWADIKNFYK